MDEKKPKKSRSDRLKAADVALWEQMTRDVARLEGREYVCVQAEDAAVTALSEGGDADICDEGAEAALLIESVMAMRGDASAAGGLPKKRGRDLDRRTYERLRKGQIRPEARIDLHGMNQEQAHSALGGFIRRCYAGGMRCVLVITGKGRPDQGGGQSYDVPVGVLRQRVPEWFCEGDLADMVLQFMPAQPKDGGTGAFYVYLRRSK